MRVQIFHNLLWSSYKGAVFSCLHHEAVGSRFDIRFVQVAETNSARASLAPVDLSYHQYPYVLLFVGNYYGVSSFRRALAAAREQRRVQADCVVINSYDDLLSWVLLIFGRLRKQKLIISLDSTYYDHPRVWYKEFVKRLFVRQCDWAFCYGTRSKEYLERLGMDSARISIRCQAAPSDRISLMRAQLTDLGSWRAPSMHARPYFLFVGRLAKEKGLHALINSFSRLAQMSDYDLLIVGAGPLEPELNRHSERLLLRDRVHFLGAKGLADLVVLYRDAFFLILPSTSEPWGLVVNEAFSLGCPAIVSDSCGCAPDLIFPDTGFIFASGNEKDLFTAMNHACAAASRRDEMGKAAEALVDGYRPDAAAAQMLAGLESCMTADVLG